jgi:hypothetical protein
MIHMIQAELKDVQSTNVWVSMQSKAQFISMAESMVQGVSQVGVSQ